MTEVVVTQRSAEWFELRQCVSLTASKFGEALGVGRGKPYHYLCSLIDPDVEESTSESECTRHGTQLEPVIDEAYQLLTGTKTVPSGFWIPVPDDPLHNIVGATPDAKVLDGQGHFIGLAEYKAPVYCMYNPGQHVPHGIPRAYMAQIQGQMAVCRKPWCDFMAVCVRTEEIMLRRVYYEPLYWTTISTILKDFANTFQVARERQWEGLPPLEFPAAHKLKMMPQQCSLFQGESTIKVQNLLQRSEITGKKFRTANDQMWMSFDFLMGRDDKT